MPGLDRTGPQGRGAMTGGRRGMCASNSRRTGPNDGYGLGRGGRPFGGGRGRGYGRGFGINQELGQINPGADTFDTTNADSNVAGLAEAIGSIVDKLNDLGETVAALYDRFSSEQVQSKKDEGNQ